MTYLKKFSLFGLVSLTYPIVMSRSAYCVAIWRKIFVVCMLPKVGFEGIDSGETQRDLVVAGTVTAICFVTLVEDATNLVLVKLEQFELSVGFLVI